MHFYAWEKGLKTGTNQRTATSNSSSYLTSLSPGMYYLRSRPAVDPIKFTLDVESLLKEAGSITVAAATASAEEPLEENPEGATDILTKKLKQNDEGDSKQAVVTAQKDLTECPMRKRRKNSRGKWEYEEEECLACGS